MTWYAKPSGAYSLGSTEANANIDEIRNNCRAWGWTDEAIAGMVGNMVGESGLNPWRWQSDRVSLTSRYKGYGLPQFTPAYGYINDYGRGINGYAPNLSTSGISSGANPSDGYAQLVVINEDRAGKFLNRQSYCDYWDISACYPMSSYKQVTDLYTATVGWLFNYEFPADHSKSVADARYEWAGYVYQYITGHDPSPPEPPDPTPGSGVAIPAGIGIKRRRMIKRK